jgi:hypothetical protein
MAQIIKLKRNLSGGNKPTTSDLAIGELAMNVHDGKVFLRRSGSAGEGDSVQEIITNDFIGTGSIEIHGAITASTFVGDGSGLTNISVSQNATVKQTFTNSVSWSVEHNLSTPNAIVQVYDSNDFQMIPGTLQIIDDDNVLATFPTIQSGYVVVAKGGHIVSGSVDAGDISGLGTSVLTKVNELGVFSGSSQIALAGDVTGTASATVIGTVDGDTF